MLNRSGNLPRPALYVSTLALVYIVVVGMFTAQMAGMREQAITKNIELAESLVHLLDDQVQRSLQSASILTEALADQFLQRNRAPDLQRFMSQLSNLPELRGVVIADSDGRVIASSMGDEDLGVDISGSPGVAASRESSRSTMHIGSPVSSRSVAQTSSGGPPFIPLTRPIVDGDGRHIGFIVALLSVSYFETQYAKLSARQGGSIYMSRYDGTLLVSNRVDATPDEWSKSNPIFLSALPDNERGVIQRRSAGGAEILAFRVTRHWPVVVAVGFEEAKILSSWVLFATKGWAVVLLLLALISFSMAILLRKDQVAARQSAFLKSIIDNMSDGLVVYDKLGNALVSNTRFLDQFGLTQGPPPTARRMAARVLRRSKPSSSIGRQSLGSVLRRERASAEAEMQDGLVLDIRSAPMPEEAYVFLVSDVTQRHRHAEEIRSSEATKNAIIMSALDCIIVADKDGCITEFNPGAERTFGWRADEVVGRELAETIVPLEMRQLHREGMRRFVRTGVGALLNRRIEVQALRRNGEVFPCELAISPIEANGEICFTAYLRDISARKRGEAELQGAREAAERANRAKSAFLAHISHEIRTPMNAVVGYSTLLLDTSLDDEQRQFACGISESADALLYLINDVLDLSQLEAGKLGVGRAPFVMASVVESVAKVTKVLADKKGIDFHLLMNAHESDVFLGDAGRLRQVLLNLTGNAVKFTKRGFVTLRADVLPGEDGALRAVFAVYDTGSGIAAEALDRIFEPFEQAGRVGKIKGSGLGLSISRDIARLMGGDITVQSTQGAGSVFKFEAPFERVLAQHHSAIAPEPALYSPGRRLKILVAEDTPASSFVLCKSLEKRGHEVIAAHNGKQAVALAHSEKPDLIFMDIQMPEMDGLTATRLLRASDGPVSAIPVVALTAQAFVADREAALAAGMQDFIAKPVRPDELDRALSLWGGWKADKAPAGPEPEVSALDMLIADIGEEAAGAFIRSSLDNARVLLDDIEASRHAGDMRRARRHAHSLAGLFAQMGLDALSNMMRKAEERDNALRDLDISQVDETIQKRVEQLFASSQSAQGGVAKVG